MNALARLIPDFDAPHVAVVQTEPTLLSFVEAVDKPAPGPDLAAVEARARAEARAEAEAECERLRAEDRVRFDEELAESRRGWAEAEGERLAKHVTDSLAELEASIAETAARAIGPFLAAPMRTRAIDELGEAITSLLADNEHPNLRVTGPQDLLDRIRTHLGDRAASISFQPGETADVRVISNSTVIETRLRAWLDRLAEAAS